MFYKKPGVKICIHSGACILYGSRAFLCLVMLIVGLKGVSAQNKRFVAIGSSTTAGYVTTSADSGWVARFAKYYKCQTGIADACINYGEAGSDVYAGMPTGYQPPPGRPGYNPASNVTKAVNTLKTLVNPDDGVIIVNYPTNNYNTYSLAEIMNCLQVIYDSATGSGNRCFIATTQPRSDALFSSSAMKKKLADIKDSIISRFGVEHTVNFWDGMLDRKRILPTQPFYQFTVLATRYILMMPGTALSFKEYLQRMCSICPFGMPPQVEI